MLLVFVSKHHQHKCGLYTKLALCIIRLKPLRCWEIISEHKVSKFYTAPTAIRSLMKFGNDQTKVIERTPRNKPTKERNLERLKEK